MLGTFGDVVFEVSSDHVRTWSKFTRQKKATYAEHKVLAGSPLLELTGYELESVAITVRFDIAQGLIPEDEMERLRRVRDDAIELPLTISGKLLGYYVLEDVSEDWKRTTPKGVVTSSEVNLKLKEYIRGN